MTEPTREVVLAHIIEMKGEQGEIKGKLDTIIENHEKRLDKAEENIGSLRRWRTGVVSVGSVVATILGISLKP